ncbi:hypothetical protein ACIQUM_37565 [Amycolatopsis azurea]|uniref:hypothetical protein n=1 Tax=Amycolatopsis azurea TaxID=36819 RepID=UPI00380FD859
MRAAFWAWAAYPLCFGGGAPCGGGGFGGSGGVRAGGLGVTGSLGDQGSDSGDVGSGVLVAPLGVVAAHLQEGLGEPGGSGQDDLSGGVAFGSSFTKDAWFRAV